MKLRISPLTRRAFIPAGLVAILLITVAGVASATADRRGQGTVTVEAEQAPTKWIVSSDPNAQDNATGTPPAGTPHAAPKAVKDGPWSSTLATAGAGIVPSGSTVVSRTDLPDLRAATVVFRTREGTMISIAVQRRQQPVTLTTITAYQNDGQLAEWPSGTQYVQIDRKDQHLFQVIVARPSGLFLTTTLATKDLDHPIAWSDTFTRSSLLASIRQHLDTDTIESVTG